MIHPLLKEIKNKKFGQKMLSSLAILMLTLSGMPVSAVVPISPTPDSLVMYAVASTNGEPVAVNVAPYDSKIYGHKERLDVTNVYGAFDAVSTTGINEYFFGVASREWTNYTFGDKFYNVSDLDADGNVINKEIADIKFREVTWGKLGTWHAEGTLVFLTGAMVRGADGKLTAYTPTAQEGSYGYFAGIAANKEAINGFTDEQKEAIRQEYAVKYGVASREFFDNTISMDADGVRSTTFFHMPDEVVYAEGVTLVDITEYLYDYGTIEGQEKYPTNAVGTPTTYSGGSGKLLTYIDRTTPFDADLKMDDSINAKVDPGTGNTDGFDLDAIAVYKYVPWRTDDTATGLGKQILTKGNWFMYNEVDFTNTDVGATETFDLQAGNPKNGLTKIGIYTVTNNGDGTFKVTYDINDTITINGYVYDIVKMDEHLGISDTMSFKAKPGQDDNQDFEVPFEDADGKFYVFAHFSVEYR